MTRALFFLAWLVFRVYAAFRPVARITDGAGTLLITRWFLTSRPGADGSTGTPGWYLHRIENPDTATEEHTHPWRGDLWVLRGRYVEFRRGRSCARRAGTRATLLPNESHRIVFVEPGTWTLFRAGPKHGRGWGFVQADGTVRPAREGRRIPEVQCNGHYSSGPNHDPCGWAGQRSELRNMCCPVCGAGHLLSVGGAS